MKFNIKNTLSLVFLFILFSSGVFASENYTNVGLFYSGSAFDGKVNISADNGFIFSHYDDSTGEFTEYDSTDCTNITIRIKNGTSLITENSKSSEVIVSGESTLYLSDSAFGTISINGTTYPDYLKFTIDSNGNIKVINVVDTEQYLKGVLPSEVYTTWHDQALKTAAIAARTFTLNSVGGKHSSIGFDVCDTTCCQVYSGTSKLADSTNKAVDETTGLVVTYNGKLATTVYHAISGGMTESAAGAWGGDPDKYPYLTQVKTPLEQYHTLSKGKWTSFITPQDLLDYINTSTTKKGVLSGSIADISYSAKTGNHIQSMVITDENNNKITINNSANISTFFKKFVYSPNFDIKLVPTPSDNITDCLSVITKDGVENAVVLGVGYNYLTADGKKKAYGTDDIYVIDGKGYGHGVGLSQYGAQFAAKSGYTFEQILATYYPGTKIEKKY